MGESKIYRMFEKNQKKISNEQKNNTPLKVAYTAIRSNTNYDLTQNVCAHIVQILFAFFCSPLIKIASQSASRQPILKPNVNGFLNLNIVFLIEFTTFIIIMVKPTKPFSDHCE